jgi:hypothetical protein
LRRSSVDPWGDLTARMHAITVIPDYFHLQHLAHAQQRCYVFQQLTTPLSLHHSTEYGTQVLCLRAAGQTVSWMDFSELSSNKDALYMSAIMLRTPKVAAVLNTRASYSECWCFKSRPGDLLDTDSSWFSSSFQESTWN